MWNPFKKKLLQLEETTPKYRVNKIIKEYLIHKYTCTIKMVNGEIFKTDLFDKIQPNQKYICLIMGEFGNWKDTLNKKLIVYNYLSEPRIDAYSHWEFDYQGTTMKLNSDQISYVHYTKIPFETRQVEEDELVLIEETSNE